MHQAEQNDSAIASAARAVAAAFFGWVMPGLGHIFLGHRRRGLVFLVTITATFWTGVAIGGVRGTVDPKERTLWFAAQVCTGGNTGAAYVVHRATGSDDPHNDGKAVVSNWVSAEVGLHYTGVAGLLNLLVILDVLSRAEAPWKARRRSSGAGGGGP